MKRRAIPNYPGYFACSDGRIFGIRFKHPLRQSLNGPGYKQVTLCNDGGPKIHAVHRLIAAAFCPGHGRDVNHKNGDKADNRADNLEWCSRSSNQRHAADIGLKPSGEKSHLCTKLKTADVLQIRKLLKKRTPQSKIGNLFNVSQSLVSKIKNRHKWRQLRNP